MIQWIHAHPQGEKPKDSCINFLKRSRGPTCGDGHGGASCGDRIATFILYLRCSKAMLVLVFSICEIF